tara:strand:- start:408 stop:599 length:192 start_codon:yes stop_codon:yes gene_type:complete
MITNEQRENNKAINLYYDTVADFEWEREQFNKRMIELYPEAYPVKTFDINSRQLTNIKTRRTK